MSKPYEPYLDSWWPEPTPEELARRSAAIKKFNELLEEERLNRPWWVKLFPPWLRHPIRYYRHRKKWQKMRKDFASQRLIIGKMLMTQKTFDEIVSMVGEKET